MFTGHFFCYRNVIVAVSCRILVLVVLAMNPGFAGASSGYNVCIEDGGQADCTYPLAVVQPGEYTLWEIRDPSIGNALWPGLNSDQDISNQISSLSPGCDTQQNPKPPYIWNAQGENANGDAVSITPNISATLYEGNNCTQPGPRTFYGQLIQPQTCPAGWNDGRGTVTKSFPHGYCWRPAVQCCQMGQPTQAVGKPIDVALGNETEQEADYFGGGASPLRFVRTYNYAGTILGPGKSLGATGQGWSHSYEARLWFYPGGAIRALRPDGNHRVFVPVNGQYQEFGTAVDQLTALQSGGVTTGWELVDGDDTKEFYDNGGNLMSITYRGGASVSMTYSTASTPPSIAPYAGLLITVSDNFGHQLNFTYNGQGQIVTMTDPGGAVFKYSGSAVQFPDSSSRQYLYNESAYTSNTNIPYALTGIVDRCVSR